MIDNKVATSNVEEKRERFEEPIRTYGSAVRAERIWRDTDRIGSNPPTVDVSLLNPSEPCPHGHVLRKYDGASVINILDYYYKLPLSRVLGTSNCFESRYLVNVITADIFGEAYSPILYIDDNELAYGLGQPLFDVAAGTVYFNDKDFVEKLVNKNIYISFFKYVGRTGSSNNEDLPFRDDIAHFKDVETDDGETIRRASFKVRGDNKTTNYVLPPENGKWYDKGTEQNTGVIVLQENIEDILWEQDTRISGGEWVELNGIKSTYKYDAPSVEDKSNG